MGFFVNLVGWIGTLLMISAYFLVSTKRVKSSDVSYQLMNLLGAVGLGINVFYQKAWPAVAFEALWVSIAIYALLKKGDPMDMRDLS